ncbi:disease resistance protein Pik-1-like [Lycium barbarum]|uniref:disease resistance protein Pik-1-like n=1 Tax=Lycium barbarum TaxID=112863 RepID=UPI00293F42DD|nr:disease resistance protein Pik-1-like [Lycium barbarum]
MQTKVVVNVSMNGQLRPSLKKRIFGCLVQDTTCKYKVMKIAAPLPGVERVSIEADLLTVIGEGIDTVELVNILRKKVGFAKIVTQNENTEETTQPQPQPQQQPTVINQVLPMVEMFEIRDPYYYNNSCFPWW